MTILPKIFNYRKYYDCAENASYLYNIMIYDNLKLIASFYIPPPLISYHKPNA